jgi:hypothetical protein
MKMTDLDSIIDAAAREITAAPSPVDLRARVVREIQDRTAEAVRHRTGLRRPPLWPLLAAAAGIVVVVYLAWPARLEIETVPPPAVKGVEPESPTWRLPPERPSPPLRVRRPPAPVPSDPAIASIPALETPAAIGIAPLDAAAEPVPALDAVAPLNLEQLDIKPLTPPGPAAGGQ